ncbi:uncharacterized protein TRAVEDRAFT_52832 [Trametes versicolor FP-101664 SS1]|uniref:uncharacterized protein n=1 Tax=Trametes versicolor (strain FP-101664) TaxID=717944 RepID=UPI0004623B18|nr:uncharacterized protein TRAVEDRAFT_52832 [Trametes versicolor FP-101664 SS1]EIW53713.1 hypothetical protein TRAVEDRAFT_52832 [Trametes versicolor FP-101664 SS1]
MHKSNGTASWLARPLPAALQTYAAHDLTLIALVYAQFTRQPWVRTRIPTLQAQSAAYVGMLDSREENERRSGLDIMRFMPLGIIDGGEDDDSVPRYTCSCCHRDLAASCYSMGLQSGAERGGGPRMGQPPYGQRLSFCRLCNAVAQKHRRAQGEWVAC